MSDWLVDLGEENGHGNSLNALVILDETHLYSNRDKTDNQKLKDLRAKLLDAVRIIRKYGLAWIYLSASYLSQ